MTVQERQWESYKDVCTKRKVRLGDISKEQYDMMERSGYIGPVRTKVCFTTELRHNTNLADSEEWVITGDGIIINPDKFKVTDKDYNDFARFYNHNYVVQEASADADDTEPVISMALI
ncbi:hypothetical protein SARC_05792 [Sphaeroforma arctica JP610]|uniref:Uncharacterized protein n=1 Tax=Sphaeroforma arctica JP610 TaxID=667725 RepID=A0A0L0FYH9_9EUKA|nr:hypothetical protein SARC_05792 [Sphaeroforma arctica JP610]KNC81902.1 hypothetical protein SARC_05792 [Sphaeroforma arctica JP610]|eukprot:XP_014155804.1 hypothetical protein SARC_05792 [Sphaeroforma arctica JP610]